jgi:hypothetical protein
MHAPEVEPLLGGASAGAELLCQKAEAYTKDLQAAEMALRAAVGAAALAALVDDLEPWPGIQAALERALSALKGPGACCTQLLALEVRAAALTTAGSGPGAAGRLHSAMPSRRELDGQPAPVT